MDCGHGYLINVPRKGEVHMEMSRMHIVHRDCPYAFGRTKYTLEFCLFNIFVGFYLFKG